MNMEKARSFLIQGDYEMALQELEAIPEGDRVGPEYWVLRSSVLFGLDRDEAARDCLDYCLELWPKDPDVQFEQAVQADGYGDFLQAEGCYTRLLESLSELPACEWDKSIIDMSLWSLLTISEERNRPGIEAKARELRERFRDIKLLMTDELLEEMGKS